MPSSNAKPFRMRVGRFDPAGLVHHKYRSLAQFETVRKIVEQADFDFACNNPFDTTTEYDHRCLERYKGPFMFSYYTKDGKLHFQKLNWRGQSMKHLVSPGSGERK